MQRILVVDDDASMREVIKGHLSALYEVIDTGAPEAALAMTLEHKPDAILLDLSMPGLSGFELCQVLSSLSVTEQIPIFIVTGEDERNKAFCENLGALKYFTKPIDFDLLEAIILARLAGVARNEVWPKRVEMSDREIETAAGHASGVFLRARALNKDRSPCRHVCSSCHRIVGVP